LNTLAGRKKKDRGGYTGRVGVGESDDGGWFVAS